MAEMDDPIFTMWAPGEPRGKGRPRARIIKPKGGAPFVSMYTPAETAEYEAELAAAAVDVWREPALTCALTAYIEVFVPIPVSWSNRKRAEAAAGLIAATSRPDMDNYIKIALDALNNIVFRDDSQVVSLQSIKLYSETPGLRVSFWLWDDVGPDQEALL